MFKVEAKQIGNLLLRQLMLSLSYSFPHPKSASCRHYHSISFWNRQFLSRRLTHSLELLTPLVAEGSTKQNDH